jgi:hypothetical protein
MITPSGPELEEAWTWFSQSNWMVRGELGQPEGVEEVTMPPATNCGV